MTVGVWQDMLLSKSLVQESSKDKSDLTLGLFLFYNSGGIDVDHGEFYLFTLDIW